MKRPVRGWVRPGAPRQADEFHAERFHLGLLGDHVLAFGVEANDGVDTQHLQFGIRCGLGLRAAVQVCVHLAEIIDADDRYFDGRCFGVLPVCGAGEGSVPDDEQ